MSFENVVNPGLVSVADQSPLRNIIATPGFLPPTSDVDVTDQSSQLSVSAVALALPVTTNPAQQQLVTASIANVVIR